MILTLSTPVFSQGTFTESQVVAAILSRSPRTPYTTEQVHEIVARTIHWARIFDFNTDLILSQMIHETNYFVYGGDVPASAWNFAGLGATGGVPGHSFPNIDTGVLAVVAHHAVYRWGAKERWPAHLQQYAGDHVDPRYSAVLSTGNAGKMLVLGDYRGTWAVPGRTYPESLITRSKQIDVFPRGEEPPMAGDMPGVPFVPADSRHHKPGRDEPWPYYFIQHHSDGFDSLTWLTTSANSEVSATYLLNNNGTVRAQLVRHADTPWTTGRMNDDSISAEWERYWSDPARRQFADGVPDEVYRNIGAFWARVASIERERGNPHFQGTPLRDQMRDHNDFYSTVCPGNLDMNRVYRELVAVLEAPPPPEDGTRFFAETGQYIFGGFKGFFEELEADGTVWRVLGYPKTGEFKAQLGPLERTVQRFQKAYLVWLPEADAPWHVQLALLDEVAEIVSILTRLN